MSYTNTGDFVRLQKAKHAYSSPLLGAVVVGLNYDNTKPHKATKKRSATAVYVRMLGNVIEELGWEPLSYYEMLEGTGSSAGKLLIRRTDDPTIGYKLSLSSSGKDALTSNLRTNTGAMPACVVKFGMGALQWHVLAADERPTKACDWRIFNSELLVDMPEWFMPTESNIAMLRKPRQVIEHDARDMSRRRSNKHAAP